MAKDAFTEQEHSKVLHIIDSVNTLGLVLITCSRIFIVIWYADILVSSHNNRWTYVKLAYLLESNLNNKLYQSVPTLAALEFWLEPAYLCATLWSVWRQSRVTMFQLWQTMLKNDLSDQILLNFWYPIELEHVLY